MAMKARLVMAATAGLLLGVCYETDETVFAMDGGDPVSLKQGVYQCTSGDPRDTSSYRVMPREKDFKYTYTVESEGATNKETMVLAFHRVAEHRYAGVTAREAKGKVVPGQSIVLVHSDDAALKTMRLSDERSEQLAKKHDVDLRGAAYAIGGPIENQRAFIREAAVDPSLEMVLSCKFVSS
jgi:hypothetical protein